MKRIFTVLLAVVLVAGGLGGFVYAKDNSLTGQKLVGYGFYDEHYLQAIGRTLHLHTLFVFTNPDSVSEITINRVFIFAFDGTVLEWWVPVGDDAILEPHEVSGVELQNHIPFQDLLMPVTVEIFWTASDEKGLPLIGWAQTGHSLFDEAENLIQGSATETQMVNMEQKLTPRK